MVRGAAWMVMLRFVVRAIGVVSIVILARLLVPEDFGLVALAATFVGLLELIGDLSLELILIRYPRRDEDLYNTAWTISVIRGLIIAGLLVGFEGTISRFFGDDRLGPLLGMLALGILIASMKNVGFVEFRKELKLHKEFQLVVAQKLVSFTVTLAIAVIWRNYWALVAGIVTAQVVMVAGSYYMHPYRPRVCLKRWKELMGFSVWLALASVAGALSVRAPTFVLARFGTAADVGTFTVGKEIAELPTTELVWPIANALYPGYASYVGDIEKLRALYVESYAVIFLLSAPLGAGIACTAPWIVSLFLGEKWLGTVPVIQVLAIAGLVRMMSTGATAIYLTLAKSRVYFMTSLAGLIIAIPVLVAMTIWWGLTGAVYAYLIGAAAITALHLGIVIHLLKIPLMALVTGVWRSVAAAVAMTAVVGWTGSGFDTGGGPLATATELALLVVVGAAVHIGVQAGFWKLQGAPESAETRVLGQFRDVLARFKAR